MAPRIEHPTLRGILEGVEIESHSGVLVTHFRGIQYGRIPRRFAKPEMVDDWDNQIVDCTKFGPHCPQNSVDAEHLLRIPERSNVLDNTEQDEFRCLNLCVSSPSRDDSRNQLLPVLIWIYGGSQIVAFPPLSHPVGDTTPLVAHSIIMGKPIIIVTFNYRLNVFAFGNGSETNLALKDQRTAIDWVVAHIHGFGGDKNNLTLAGESAGAVFVDAHFALGAPIKRGILHSGSLYLSPPQPLNIGAAFIKSLEEKVNEIFCSSLAKASVDELLSALREQNVNRVWLQADDEMAHLTKSQNQVSELLIGDCEYESTIWRNGIEEVSVAELDAIFDLAGDHSSRLKNLYCISPNRPTATRLGALDFINDVAFALPVEDIVIGRWERGLKTYRYVFDQANPWQSSSRAHHGVDIIFLFGGYESKVDETARSVGQSMQERWINFVNGEAPWDAAKRFVFGPVGRVGVIGEAEFAIRRRMKHFALLRAIDPLLLNIILGKLVAGRVSLLN